MGDLRRMTPRVYDQVWTSTYWFAPHMLEDAGTFNGTSYAAAASGSLLSSRWTFTSYTATNPTDERVAQFSHHLPQDYIDGTDIKIAVIWTSSEVPAGGGEDVRWEVGVTRQNGAVLGGESETEYIEVIDALNSASGEFKCTKSGPTTFDGANLTNGEKISVIVARDEPHANDSADDTAYVNGIVIYYQRESIEQETNTNLRKMTPVEHVPLYRGVSYGTHLFFATSGTYDGLSTTAVSSTPVLNDRWSTLSYPDASDRSAFTNWWTPLDYKDGTDIKLTIKYFGSTASTNSVWVYAGMTNDAVDNTYGDESDSEYLAPAGGSPTAMSGTAESEESLTWTFDGSGVLADEPIAFIVVRQGNAAGDDYTGDFRIISARIEYQTNEEGDQSV